MRLRTGRVVPSMKKMVSISVSARPSPPFHLKREVIPMNTCHNSHMV